MNPDNWSPFVPDNEGGFRYGWQGVLRAASIIFFAYVGFEAVSTAAGESHNPAEGRADRHPRIARLLHG